MTVEPTQAPTIRCECGLPVRVIPESAYEFAWRCDHCQRAGVVSWSHEQDPPRFLGETQGELW